MTEKIISMRSEVQISNKGKILEGILLFKPILYKDIRGIFNRSTEACLFST